ncbi:MAG: hypothetical protein LBC99_09325 [Spirochaetota bacterium]|jgi:hypothetical protein|nr:hypothetical protein [Spirochaetota bacterium]
MKIRYAILLLLALAAWGCGADDDEITVWVESGTYSEYLSIDGPPLDDGYYIMAELSNEEFHQTISGTSRKERQVWPKSRLTGWFVERGCTGSEADQLTAQLIAYNHAIFIVRRGNNVWLLVK